MTSNSANRCFQAPQHGTSLHVENRTSTILREGAGRRRPSSSLSFHQNPTHWILSGHRRKARSQDFHPRRASPSSRESKASNPTFPRGNHQVHTSTTQSPPQAGPVDGEGDPQAPQLSQQENVDDGEAQPGRLRARKSALSLSLSLLGRNQRAAAAGSPRD